MKLSSTELYLSHMLEAFETSIMPELQSATAQVSAGIIKHCFEELLRRERTTPALLLRSNRQGAEILVEMRRLLEKSGAAVEAEAPLAGANAAVGQLIDDNERITAEMTLLLRRLDAHRDGIGTELPMSELLLRCAHWEFQLHSDLLQSAPRPAEPVSEVQHRPEQFLEGFLRSVHEDGERIEVRNIVRAEGGSGKQTYLFTLVEASGRERELVLRKADRVLMITRDAYVIENEYHLLLAVAKTGFLAPQPFWFGKDVPGVDGDFFIMECLPGKIPGTFLGGAEQISESYLLDLARLMAQLHNLELDAFADYIARYQDPVLLEETIEQFYRRTIAEWREYCSAAEQLPSPALEYMLDWLARNVPENSARPVLVHGDFNIHNILGDDGRATGVLDWEGAMFGAPEQDLAYIQPHISQHIDWNRFVDHYLKSGGKPINTEAMDFYAAVSGMRVMNGLCKATTNLQTGASKDFRLFMVELGYVIEFMKLGGVKV